MDSVVEIKTVKIKIGPQEIEFTADEARKLKAALDELFGKKVIKEVIYTNSPCWYWTSPPVYIPQWPTIPQITWSASCDSGTLTIDASSR